MKTMKEAVRILMTERCGSHKKKPIKKTSKKYKNVLAEVVEKLLNEGYEVDLKTRIKLSAKLLEITKIVPVGKVAKFIAPTGSVQRFVKFIPGRGKVAFKSAQDAQRAYEAASKAQATKGLTQQQYIQKSIQKARELGAAPRI